MAWGAGWVLLDAAALDPRGAPLNLGLMGLSVAFYWATIFVGPGKPANERSPRTRLSLLGARA